MRRLFWLAMGATIGVLIVRKLTRAARSFTPRGIAASATDSVTSVAAAVRDFAGEVRAGMAERETQLMAGTGLDGRLGARPEDF